MSKLLHIIRREYVTRVRKRTFIIMSVLGPFFFAAFMIIPFWLTTLEDRELKTIAVVELDKFNKPVPDSLLFYKDVIKDQKNLKFDYLSNVSYDDIQTLMQNTGYYGFLVLRHSLINQKKGIVEFFTRKQPGLGIETHIKHSVETFLYENKLQLIHVPPETIHALETEISIQVNKYEKGGFREQKLTDIKRGVGYVAGFLIYFFIFFFGAQVMRGVIEEKSSRIIEVIITSVRPFQLMMGKIVGIALVGLTQFLVWIMLTTAIFQSASGYYLQSQVKEQTRQQVAQSLFNPDSGTQEQPDQYTAGMNNLFMPDYLKEINFVLILVVFAFYFIGGYLLYGAMFAAIGSAVDSDTDTQQFMLPVTLPLILSVVLMFQAVTNPEGQLTFWFSMIPFTSPVIMMARIPFGVPVHELIISAVILLLTFILFTFMAAKIYRIGILMYGKKTGYREIFKWLTYKDS